MSDLKILVVDDEYAVREMLTFVLENAGFQVVSVPSGEHALQWLLDNTADLVVLDWVVPSISGIDLAQVLKVKTRYASLPIIMLTARNEVDNKVHALEMGVDDYMTKPFSTKELVARIKVLLRRQPKYDHSKLVCVGDLILNADQRQLLVDGQELDLTPIEYKLLEFLMRYPNKIHSRKRLLEEVWGRSIYIEERTVDVQIGRMRIRLSEYGREKLIQTVRGLGYRFSMPNTAN